MATKALNENDESPVTDEKLQPIRINRSCSLSIPPFNFNPSISILTHALNRRRANSFLLEFSRSKRETNGILVEIDFCKLSRSNNLWKL